MTEPTTPASDHQTDELLRALGERNVWSRNDLEMHDRMIEEQARAEGRREAVREIRESVGEGTEVDHHGNTAVYIDDLRDLLDDVAPQEKPR